MSSRLAVSLAAVAALVALLATTADGQTGPPTCVSQRVGEETGPPTCVSQRVGEETGPPTCVSQRVGEEVRHAAKTTASTGTPWIPARTVDGQPDLQGVWGNNSVTPLQRPKAWAGKKSLTPEEVAELKKLAANVLEGEGDAIFGDGLVEQALAGVKGGKSYDPTTGNYNHFWLVDRDFDDRTSLITDPADGRLPPLTAEAEKRRNAATEARKLHPARTEEKVYEYACHEGNLGMVGILSGHRAQEKGVARKGSR